MVCSIKDSINFATGDCSDMGLYELLLQSGDLPGLYYIFAVFYVSGIIRIVLDKFSRAVRKVWTGLLSLMLRKLR